MRKTNVKVDFFSGFENNIFQEIIKKLSSINRNYTSNNKYEVFEHKIREAIKNISKIEELFFGYENQLKNHDAKAKSIYYILYKELEKVFNCWIKILVKYSHNLSILEALLKNIKKLDTRLYDIINKWENALTINEKLNYVYNIKKNLLNVSYAIDDSIKYFKLRKNIPNHLKLRLTKDESLIVEMAFFDDAGMSYLAFIESNEISIGKKSEKKLELNYKLKVSNNVSLINFLYLNSVFIQLTSLIEGIEIENFKLKKGSWVSELFLKFSTTEAKIEFQKILENSLKSATALSERQYEEVEKIKAEKEKLRKEADSIREPDSAKRVNELLEQKLIREIKSIELENHLKELEIIEKKISIMNTFSASVSNTTDIEMYSNNQLIIKKDKNKLIVNNLTDDNKKGRPDK